mgnify:FL=1
MRKIYNYIRALLRAQSPNNLFHLIFFITARCNARCKFCFYLDQIEAANKNLHKELTLSEIDKIFNSMGYIPYISLSGGEPFLRKDFTEMVDIIVRNSNPLVVSIPTNGAYTDRIFESMSILTKKFKNTQFDIQLSLDAPEEIHDEVRQVPGLFKKMIETNKKISELRKIANNLGIKIVITYSEFNQNNVEELISYIEKDLIFDRLILSKVHGNSAGKENLNYEKFNQLLKRVNSINTKDITKRGFTNKISLKVKNAKEKIRSNLELDKNLGKYCNVGKKLLVMSEQGDIYPCEVLSKKIGNVKEVNFNLKLLLKEKASNYIQKENIKNCHCDWGCAQNIAIVTNKKFLSKIILD